jgi:hypothetical protein
MIVLSHQNTPKGMTYWPYQLPPGPGTSRFLAGDSLTVFAGVTIVHRRLASIDRPTECCMLVFPYPIALAPKGIIGVRGHGVLMRLARMGKERRGAKGGADRKRSIRVKGMGKGLRGGGKRQAMPSQGPHESPLWEGVGVQLCQQRR